MGGKGSDLGTGEGGGARVRGGRGRERGNVALHGAGSRCPVLDAIGQWGRGIPSTPPLACP